MGKKREISFYIPPNQSGVRRWQGSLTPYECSKLEYIMQLDAQGGRFDGLVGVKGLTDDKDICAKVERETGVKCATYNPIKPKEWTKASRYTIRKEGLELWVYTPEISDVRKIINSMETTGKMPLDVDYDKQGTLRDEQTIGVAYMFFAKNCLLGDSVGMGKTVQTAGLVNELYKRYTENGKVFRFLMLTKKNLVEQVRSEMIKFTGQYVEVLGGEKSDVEAFAAKHHGCTGLPLGVVGSHSLLTQKLFLKWMMECETNGYGRPFQLLVVDESTVLGTSTTDITRGAKEIIPKFNRVIFLSATPFTSKLSTFYTQLNLLDKKMMPTKTEFEKRYVVFEWNGSYKQPSGKYKNEAEFGELIKYRYLARTRKDKGAKMIDCKKTLLVSPLSPVQKWWLSRTKMYRMVYDCPNAIDPLKDIEFNEDNVPKLQSLHRALTVECKDAKTILMYVHFREAQDSLSTWLTKRGYSNRVLCGETNDADRQSIINGFKNGEFRILITNVQEGLNFGDCNYCIFYSFEGNTSSMVQFEGRITRSFDVVGKHIILLVSEGRERDRLNSVIKERAKAMVDFTNVDLSCIMDLLLG